MREALLKFTARLGIFLMAAVLFISCSTEGDFALDGTPVLEDEEYLRTPPPVQLSGYTGENVLPFADGNGNGNIDISNQNNGYVVVNCYSDVRVKFRLQRQEEEITYDLNNRGEYEVFPFSMGSGSYELTVFIQAPERGDSAYYPAYVTQVEVALSNDFAPFLVPNQIVNYTEQSQVVAFTQELTKHCKTNLEVVREIYHWVTTNVEYDTEKATRFIRENPPGYLPVVDETLLTKKGICFDYAALTAAMMRINGIPCQLIRGLVSQGEGRQHHAWNMIWLEESGWIAVKFEAKPNEWQRIDLTFAASGDPSVTQFIGDGQHYSPTNAQ